MYADPALVVPERRRGALSALVLTVSLAAGLLTACGESENPTDGATLTAMDHIPYPVDDSALTTLDGQPFSLASDLDRPLTLVFFGYTNCPDICPLVMSTMASAMVRLEEDERSQVEVLFITSDPKRDTPAVIGDYLDHYDPNFVGLTGDIDTIAGVAESLHIYVSDGTELPSGGYDFNAHGTQITGMDSDGQATVLWSQDVSPATLATDIRILLQESR